MYCVDIALHWSTSYMFVIGQDNIEDQKMPLGLTSSYASANSDGSYCIMTWICNAIELN